MKPVTLHDGRLVDSSSAEWRLECMANDILKMPDREDRKAWLVEYEERHGSEKSLELRDRVTAIYDSRRPK